MDKLPLTFVHQLLASVTITERERFRGVSRQWNALALSYRPTLQVSYLRVHEETFMVKVDMYSVQGVLAQKEYLIKGSKAFTSFRRNISSLRSLVLDLTSCLDASEIYKVFTAEDVQKWNIRYLYVEGSWSEELLNMLVSLASQVRCLTVNVDCGVLNASDHPNKLVCESVPRLFQALSSVQQIYLPTRLICRDCDVLLFSPTLRYFTTSVRDDKPSISSVLNRLYLPNINEMKFYIEKAVANERERSAAVEELTSELQQALASRKELFPRDVHVILRATSDFLSTFPPNSQVVRLPCGARISVHVL
uniref:F-box domain-containing protein n=2 Tax=Parascaris TaxID=6254 RepID=A0A915CFA9_PARUN